MSQFPEEIPATYQVESLDIGYVGSKQARAYEFEFYNINLAAGVPTNVWWFRNDSVDNLELVIYGFLTSWDGGDTTFIRTLRGRFIAGAPEPTANHQPAVVLPNSNTTPPAPITAYQWNGVGAGMTVAGGFHASTQFFAPGISPVNVGGAFLVRAGEGLMGQYQAAEAGEMAVTTAFVMSKVGSL